MVKIGQPLNQSISDSGFDKFLNRPFEGFGGATREWEEEAGYSYQDLVDHVNNSVIHAQEFASVVADSPEGIQATIDHLHSLGGGVVHLKSGTYPMSSNITLYSNIELNGEDDDTSIIDFNNTTYYLSILGEAGNYKRNVRLKNLQIRNGRNTTYGALRLDYAEDCDFSHVYFKDNANLGASTGLDCYIYDSQRIDFSNIRMSGEYDGFYLESSGECHFNKIRTSTVKHDVFEINSCERTWVTRLYCYENDHYGFYVRGGSIFTHIENCIFDVSKNRAVYALSSGNIHITDNDFFGDGPDSAGELILLSTSSDNTVRGNFIVGNNGDAIKVISGDHNDISHNEVGWAGGYGVNISNAASDKNRVLGNALSSCSSGAINNAGTDSEVAHNIT